MRVLVNAAKWVFMLCLPVLLLAASIGGAANSLWLYKYGFEKHNVSLALAGSGLQLSDVETERIYAGLINYFNSDEEYVNLIVVKDGKPVGIISSHDACRLVSGLDELKVKK